MMRHVKKALPYAVAVAAGVAASIVLDLPDKWARLNLDPRKPGFLTLSGN